jgi:hypothetical protein
VSGSTVRLSFPNPVDEVSARLVAGGTAVIGVICLLTRQPWLMGVLAVEFLLRVGWGPRYEPLARVMTRIVRPRLGVAPRLTPGPPKRFAQAIGALVTIAASALALGGLTPAAFALIGVLVVFATLESGFGLCVGCKVFALLMRVGAIPVSVCEECADLSLRLRHQEV